MNQALGARAFRSERGVMRYFQWAVGRVVKIALWILKSLLLLTVLGALVLWPVSCRRVVTVRAERYRAGQAATIN